MSGKTERLNLRLSESHDQLLRRAAEARGEALSDYVLRHAVEAAEIDLADRRVFLAEDAAWAELETVLDAPPTYRPRLAKLLENPSVLER